ncbi:MAG TPA: hypothetical protein VNE71_07540, partial [Myxococcota bacterium]|nr:hypothetical protein [Myxococcota bacterium]
MRLSAVPLMLAAAALAPAPSVAAPSCRVFIAIEVPGLEPVHEDLTTDGTCTLSGQSGPAFLIGDGGAAYGTLYAHSEATFLDGETDDSTTFVRVGWNDTITVDSPGHAGEMALVEGAAVLHGFIDVTGSGDATLTFDFASPFGISSAKFVHCAGGGGVCDGDFPPRFYSETIPIAFNVTLGAPGLFGLTLTTQIVRNS